MFEVLIYLLLSLFVLPLLWMAYQSMVKPKHFPPGPIGMPFIGSFHQIDPIHTKIAEVAKVYGNIFSIKLGIYNVICLNSYALIKEVLVDRAKEFASRRSFKLTRLFRGKEVEGVAFTEYGPKWSAHRKFFYTAFRNMGLNKQGLETYTRDEIPAIIEELEKSCHKEDCVDPAIVLEYASLNVLAAFAFGNRYSYGDARFQTLLHANNLFFKKIDLYRTPLMCLYDQHPFLHRLWVPSAGKEIGNAVGLIQNFAKSEIQHHKETIDRTSPRDFIDYYLLEMEKKEKWFTENRLEYTICDLFQAGTETTSTTLRWALLYVANHQEIQKKIHEEIDNVIGLNRLPNYEDRLSMPYCEATILETHRKASIAPSAILHAAYQDTSIRGYNVPKGTYIMPALYSMHHSAKYWKNPDNFDPENFLDADGKVEVNDAFMPFGTGLRICVGMNFAKLELFMFFVGILQKFQINLPDGVESLSEEPVIGGTLTPIPHKLKFIQRS